MILTVGSSISDFLRLLIKYDLTIGSLTSDFLLINIY